MVGSSRKTTSGPPMSATATDSRRRIPPEKAPAHRRAASVRRTCAASVRRTCAARLVRVTPRGAPGAGLRLLGSGCRASGCRASGCRASGCRASGCRASGCRASGCRASGCRASGYPKSKAA